MALVLEGTRKTMKIARISVLKARGVVRIYIRSKVENSQSDGIER